MNLDYRSNIATCCQNLQSHAHYTLACPVCVCVCEFISSKNQLQWLQKEVWARPILRYNPWKEIYVRREQKRAMPLSLY